jgi:hypothetical protein
MKGNGNGNGAATLSDDLITRARAIASRSDELLQLLEDARQRLVDPGEKPAPKRRFESKPADAPKRQAAPKAPKKEGISEGLRLLTTQMAVAGANHEEIASALRDEYGVKNPDPILKSLGI